MRAPATSMEQTPVHEGMTRQELLKLLQESKLISTTDLERLDATNPEANSDTLVRALVTERILSSFQVDKIRHGKAGELLIGNYEIIDRLGAGGMGTVFKARHRRMKRVVALKVLAAGLSADATFVQRFQREVEVIARLNHPNIVMAYDADEDAVGHFLVMEFVNGTDLASLVQKQGPLDVATAVDCILQAARGLEYAHRQGVIHRDVKPANLLRDDNGVVKVTDLGLARIHNTAVGADLADTNLTRVGGVMGTADYMAPEQALDSTSVDPRADIYSLGATFHYLLVGTGPYVAPTLMGTLLKHRDDPIPSLRKSRPDVPASLDDLFRRMLAKRPADRHPTMEEVVRELEALPAFLPGRGNSPLASGHSPAVFASPAAFGDTGNDQTLVARGQGKIDTIPTPTISTPTQTQSVSSLAPDPDSIGGFSVLLVEPSRTQAGIIRRYLQSLQIPRIVVVSNGQEAIQAVRENRPDEILCAMHLNDMTGVQLVRELRSALPGRAPGFVLISSESESKEAGLLSQSGQAIVLHKPFSVEELVQALRLSNPRLGEWKTPIATAATVFMKAESGVGGGSQRSASEPTKETAQSPGAPSARGELRVLLVDDSAAARMNARSVLKTLGFAQFREAADGAQAVAAVSREKIDLIVTDNNMPYMDGRGLVGYLKQNAATASIPIIMVTADNNPTHRESLLQLGVLAVIEKDFPVDVVRRIIDQQY